jgi:hypothetical protein
MTHGEADQAEISHGFGHDAGGVLTLVVVG